MASQRITAAIRDSLIAAAKTKRFAKDDEALKKRREEIEAKKNALAELVYSNLFTRKEHELKDSLPKGWMLETQSIRISIENYGVIPVNFTQAKRIPRGAHGYNSVVKVFDLKSPVGKAYTALKDMQDSLKADTRELVQAKRDLGAKVEAVITSVTTTNKLREIWPEVVELLPHASVQATVMLPAIQLDELNKELGLGKAK